MEKLAFLILVVYLLLGSSLVQAAPPTANADVRTIPTNSNITINVLSNDSDPDGDALTVISITQPAVGSATLNADGSVFFQADPSYTGGTLAFTYTVIDVNEELSVGDITIIVRNSDIAEQVTEGNSENMAETLDGLCNDLRSQSDAELGAAQAELLAHCSQLETLTTSDPETLAVALGQITPEETVAQMRIVADSSRPQITTVSQRVQQQKLASQYGNAAYSPYSFALNGSQWQGTSITGAAAGDDVSNALPRYGVFASVILDDADRDRTSLESGYDSSATTLTLGGDHFLNTRFLVGATASFSDSSLDYKNNGGELATEVTSLSAFGAYFNGNFSIYAQLGQGWIDIDSTRNIQYGNQDFTVNEQVKGSTSGSQSMFNTRAEWTWEREALSVTPFLRADYMLNKIDAYGEQGNSAFAMNLGKQEMDQLSVALGAQASYVLTPSWGVFIPTMSFTYYSEAESNRDPMTARFAYDINSSRSYMIENDGGDSAFYEFSLGGSAAFIHGISAFFEYTQTVGYDHLNASQFQLGIRFDAL
ncbi:autotransporter domain-containing protein [Teredinibacter sp. KSP-S5-2]|uniref:autotransporter domain-containing protein n=1 Tax=Teredinibacter sp. KSP-S5-2 TaxID=3034506 RepID=UPI0029352E36|nr:autotransporter domain-containing protein [Teredinibacter sp. KSP-S5-2]WNO07811.1 autotransporter domain-containing protein [Teredinibacter sp. KSP-S5-2]